MPPFLVQRQGQGTQPLAGDEATRPMLIQSFGNRQHYTNIERMERLASTHPLVSSVTPWKPMKALDPSTFDEIGRCTAFHQSKYDLSLILAASGAEMRCGCTVNGTAKSLVNLWWMPVGKRHTTTSLQHCEAIFYDIVEAEHREVDWCARPAFRVAASGASSSTAAPAQQAKLPTTPTATSVASASAGEASPRRKKKQKLPRQRRSRRKWHRPFANAQRQPLARNMPCSALGRQSKSQRTRKPAPLPQPLARTPRPSLLRRPRRSQRPRHPEFFHFPKLRRGNNPRRRFRRRRRRRRRRAHLKGRRRCRQSSKSLPQQKLPQAPPRPAPLQQPLAISLLRRNKSMLLLLPRRHRRPRQRRRRPRLLGR